MLISSSTVTAFTDEGEVMALRHKTVSGGGCAVPPGKHPDFGRQANPEQLPAPLGGAIMLPTYINKLLQGHHLTESEAESAMEVIMTGNATPAQIGGYLIALRMKGETVGEITGSALRHARPGQPGDHPAQRTPPGHGRHRRRRRSHVQRLHHRGVHHRWRGPQGGQARQSSRLIEMRQRRCAGRAWRQPRPDTRTGGDVHPAGGHRIPVCAEVSPGHEVCHRPTTRAGRAHHLQPARATDQPGRRNASTDRRLRSAAHAHDGRSVGRAGRTGGLSSTASVDWTS